MYETLFYQIKKNHIKLTKKQLAGMHEEQGQGDPKVKPGQSANQRTERSDQSEASSLSSARKDNKPWEKTPFVADGYANRYRNTDLFALSEHI